MNDLLQELEACLRKELVLEQGLKVLKEQKGELLTKLLPLIEDDVYSTDSFSLRKDFDFELDPEATELYGEVGYHVSKKKLKALLVLSPKLPGVRVIPKLVAYKKKSGLSELS